MATSWTFDPLMLLFLVLLLAGYGALIGPLRTRFDLGDPVPTGRVASFVAGWAVTAICVISPLDALGRYALFSAHTTELLLLTTLAAPLLMIGIPEWLVWRLLPLRSLRNATRGFLFPICMALAFNVIILIWHIGPLYEDALHSTPLHDLQNIAFLVAGLLTWWPLLTPLDRQTRMSTPFQMIYLGIESLPLDIFGVAAIFAPGVFYATYAHAPRIWNMSPMLDQQIAGALLAVPGNILDIILMSVIFFVWIDRIEQRQRERERAEAERELAELGTSGDQSLRRTTDSSAAPAGQA
jgi:putative membrane protein